MSAEPAGKESGYVEINYQLHKVGLSEREVEDRSMVCLRAMPRARRTWVHNRGVCGRGGLRKKGRAASYNVGKRKHDAIV